MKKLIFTFVFTAAFAAFALTPWQARTSADVELVEPASTRPVAQAIVDLYEEDSNLDTYASYKAFLAERNVAGTTVLQIAVLIPSFSRFIPGALADNDIWLVDRVIMACSVKDTTIKNAFLIANTALAYKEMPGFSQYSFIIFNNIMNIANGMSESDARTLLKSIKRTVYPRIDESEQWKQLAVKIQLALDSLD